MKFRGRLFKYGDHVDTDVIMPARYLTTHDAAEMGRHCLEDLDPTFAQRVETGDMILAGVNFGSGSSREQAVIAIQACGVGLVMAKSYSRIFYRNAVNRGLCPIQVGNELYDLLDDGAVVEVDIVAGTIGNEAGDVVARFEPVERKVLDLVENHGVINMVRAKLVEVEDE